MVRISGPLMDRFDLRVAVPPVSFQDLDLSPSGDGSSVVAGRPARARRVQLVRFAEVDGLRANSNVSGAFLEEVATPDEEGRALLNQVAERTGFRRGAITALFVWRGQLRVWKPAKSSVAAISRRRSAFGLLAPRFEAALREVRHAIE